MASISENSFGARLANAESILVHLKLFASYTPPSADLSAASLDTLLTSIRTQNTTVATQQSNYSVAVENRQQLFKKAPDSLSKLLSPIGSVVRAKYGREAKPTTDAVELINRLRGGTKIKKLDENGEKVKDGASQSEQSYGSLTQHFADLIAMLTAMGANYAPSNNAAKLPALNAKLTSIRAANTAATTAYSSLKMATDTRQSQYEDLLGRVGRIKEAVKSQYGMQSTEYALIKGLKV